MGCSDMRSEESLRQLTSPTVRSEIFKPLHPPGVLEDNLQPEQHIGPVDPTTIKPKAPRPLTEDDKRVRKAREDMPPIDAMINLYDFEVEAEKVLSKTAWAYYRSAANGEDSESADGRSSVRRAEILLSEQLFARMKRHGIATGSGRACG